LGEYDRQDFPKAFMSSEYIDKSQRLQTSMLLMHRAIATWLLSRIPLFIFECSNAGSPSHTPSKTAGRPPEFGEQTDELLAELGSG
jgi:hypothetical protein